MRPARFILSLGLAVVFVAAPCAHAQEYLFKRFGADAGIDAVHALALDEEDFLWLGTSQGRQQASGGPAALGARHHRALPK